MIKAGNPSEIDHECATITIPARITGAALGAELERLDTSTAKLRVLLVEDNAADAELILHALQKGGFDVSAIVVQTADEFRRHLKEKFPDIVLADYNLGEWKGVEALEILHREGLDIPVIMVTGALGDVKAVDCIKQGATDYVLKDSLARLPESVRRALQEKCLRQEGRQAGEELARKVNELASSNAELEQFAYAASHDLQEPLRMVAAYTQLLAERYQGKLDAQADKYIYYAVDGATRMQTLIHDLLAFSRIGKQEDKAENTDCKATVDHALQNLQASIQESGVVVECGDLPMVCANATQLQQVFQNLIGNAIKFRGAQTPVVQVSAEEKKDHWAFTVSDNGIGIPIESQQEIFVIFKRLHTRTEYSGNGMGLAICKKIVERHGGKIWIESSAEAGCSVKFTLPRVASGSAQAAKA